MGEIYKSLFEGNPSIMMIIDPDQGKIIDANPSACDYYGYSREELTARNIYDINHSSKEEVQREMELARTGKRGYVKQLHRGSNGDVRSVEACSVSLNIENQEVLCYIIHDISDRAELVEKINHLSFRDHLTGLYNKQFFLERLEYELSKKWSEDDFISIMFIDIHNFSVVNSQFGHSMGDRILKRIAEDLNKIFLDCDTVARYGGDEFIILLPYVETQEDLEGMAELVIKRIQYFCGRMDDKNIGIQVNIGITLEKKRNISVEEIINQAHIALEESKKDRHTWYRFFSPQLKERVHNAYFLENSLSNALERNEFFLLYQPIFEMEYGGLVGAEALIRWNHPKLGIIGPNDFIHIAEKNGFIIEIGEWVIRSVCRLIKRFHCSQKMMIPISVNVSAAQMGQEDFVMKVKKIIEDERIHPGYLELEITEGTAMQDMGRIESKLIQFKELGVKIAIDDFGTGYSSLSHLQNLKVDKLKIDRSFIRNIHRDSSKNITEAIINIANTFNLITVAEGIETVEQLNALKDLKTNMFQGYLYCKPITEEYLAHFIEEQMNSSLS